MMSDFFTTNKKKIYFKINILLNISDLGTVHSDKILDIESPSWHICIKITHKLNLSLISHVYYSSRIPKFLSLNLIFLVMTKII